MSIATSHHDSHLGSWSYSEHRPPRLAGLVELFWESRGTTNEPQDRHFPAPTLELLINLDGSRYDLLEPTCSSKFETTWLVGHLLGPTVVKQPRHHHVLGIRLRPAGAFALLGAPVRVVTGLVLELEDLLGGAVRDLVGRLRDAASVGARFEIVTAWLASRLAAAPVVDPAIAWAAAEIEAHDGVVPIARLRAETGLSKTRLVAAFRDQIGVPPKVYARLVRFSHALALVERAEGPLADVALSAGYYDQPHFNAEFRELTGLTPRQMLLARYPSGVPIVRPED